MLSEKRPPSVLNSHTHQDNTLYLHERVIPKNENRLNGHNNKYYMELKMISGWNDDGETGGTQIPYNLWPFTLPQHYWNNFKILLIFWLHIPLLSPASLFQPLLPNPAPLQTDDITFMVRGHKQSSSLSTVTQLVSQLDNRRQRRQWEQ